MSIPFRNKAGWAAILLTMGALCASDLYAGDPIVFSGAKAATPPAPGSAAAKIDPRLLKNVDRFSVPGPFDDAIRQPEEDPKFDRNRARRAKAAREEKMNWMWVDQGELQNRDKDDAGYRIEALDDRGDSGDLTFSAKPQSRNSRRDENRNHDQTENRVPEHLLSPRQRQVLQEKAAGERVEKSSLEDEDLTGGGKDSVKSAGNALDLRKLLGASGEKEKASGKELTLRDFLGGDQSPARTRANEERAREMKGLLGLPQNENALSTRVEPPNLRPDYSLKASAAPSSRLPELTSGSAQPGASFRNSALTPGSSPLKPQLPDLSSPNRFEPLLNGPPLRGLGESRRDITAPSWDIDRKARGR